MRPYDSVGIAAVVQGAGLSDNESHEGPLEVLCALLRLVPKPILVQEYAVRTHSSLNLSRVRLRG